MTRRSRLREIRRIRAIREQSLKAGSNCGRLKHLLESIGYWRQIDVSTGGYSKAVIHVTLDRGGWDFSSRAFHKSDALKLAIKDLVSMVYRRVLSSHRH